MSNKRKMYNNVVDEGERGGEGREVSLSCGVSRRSGAESRGLAYLPPVIWCTNAARVGSVASEGR